MAGFGAYVAGRGRRGSGAEGEPRAGLRNKKDASFGRKALVINGPHGPVGGHVLERHVLDVTSAAPAHIVHADEAPPVGLQHVEPGVAPSGEGDAVAPDPAPAQQCSATADGVAACGYGGGGPRKKITSTSSGKRAHIHPLNVTQVTR